MLKLAALASLLASGSAVLLTSAPVVDKDLQRRGAPLTKDQLDASERNSGLSSSLVQRLLSAAAKTSSKVAGGAHKPVIYFIGDSLIRNQYQALCALLEGRIPSPLRSRGGIRRVHCEAEEAYAAYMYRDFLDKDVVGILVGAGHPSPDVVYFDSCFHMLHLHPARPMDANMFQRLLHFDEELGEVLKAYGDKAPGASLDVMTPFQVCEEKYTGVWASFATSSNANPQAAAKPCVEDVVATGINEEVAQRICERSFFTKAGASHVAEAVRRVVAGLPGRLGESSMVVDQWNLTEGHCDIVEKDGRHYNVMILEQLDEFFRVNGW